MYYAVIYRPANADNTDVYAKKIWALTKDAVSTNFFADRQFKDAELIAIVENNQSLEDKSISYRDRIIFSNYSELRYAGRNCAMFINMTAETLESLVNNKYLSKYSSSGNSPKVIEILNYLKAFPGSTVFGVAFSEELRAFPVTFLGIESSPSPSEEERIVLSTLFKNKDDIDSDEIGIWGWWS